MKKVNCDLKMLSLTPSGGKNRRKRRSRAGLNTQHLDDPSGSIVPPQAIMPGTLSAFTETWMPIFPLRTRRRLRYSTNNRLAVSTGAPVSHVFIANGLYDTDLTSTGHQPMGYDQLMISYNHYAVVQARARVTFRLQDIAGSWTTTTVALRADANSAVVSNIDQILEIGGLQTVTLDQYHPVQTLSLSLDIQRFSGRKTVRDDPDLQGSVNSNPVEQQYFHLSAWCSDSPQTSNVWFDAVLEFDAWFLEPRVLSPSLVSMLHEGLKKEFTTKTKEKEVVAESKSWF